MGIEIIIYLLGFCTLLRFVFIYQQIKSSNYPKGPWSLPIFGHLPFLGNFPHRTFTAWKKTLGSVFSIEFGAFRSVVINDYKLIRETMNENSFSGRPHFQYCIDTCGGEIKGLIFTEGQEWSEQRHLAMNHLMEFGQGTKSIEAIVHKEIVELIDYLIKNSEKPVSTRISVNAAVINVLCAIITGERFQHDDSEFHSISNELNLIILEKNSISLYEMFLPWMTSRSSGHKRIVESTGKILSFLKNHVELHKKTFETGLHRDFLDIYLDEIKNTSDPESSFYRERGMKSSLFTLMDILIAGSEKTSIALTWIFLYMAKYPEVQKELQQEIENIIGKSRLPKLVDRPKMLYTEAVIYESLRFSSFVPLSVFHKTTASTRLGEFIIPSDTLIVPNLYDAHFDKSAWGDPENFRPGRFISADGKFKSNDAFLAFGVGKRSCLGENLTHDQLFLFTASIFQRFSLSPSCSVSELSTEPVGTFLLTPKSQELVLQDRF